jgi:hypothetical protein
MHHTKALATARCELAGVVTKLKIVKQHYFPPDSFTTKISTYFKKKTHVITTKYNQFFISNK